MISLPFSYIIGRLVNATEIDIAVSSSLHTYIYKPEPCSFIIHNNLTAEAAVLESLHLIQGPG